MAWRIMAQPMFGSIGHASPFVFEKSRLIRILDPRRGVIMRHIDVWLSIGSTYSYLLVVANHFVVELLFYSALALVLAGSSSFSTK